MVLGDHSSKLELTVLEISAAIPGRAPGGDVRVTAQVSYGAFAGAVDVWIAQDRWHTFHRALEALDRTRQGQAVLESQSPGELRLCVRSLDRLGHLGVEGELTSRVLPTTTRQPQALRLEFGAIEFDPTLLPVLIAELARPV